MGAALARVEDVSPSAANDNSAGTLLRRYVHGAGVDEPIVWYEGATTADPRWLFADAQGSIIAASDGAGVLTGSRYRYGPYGEPNISG